MRRGELQIGIGNRYLSGFGYGVGVGARDRLRLGLSFGLGSLGIGFRLGMAVGCGPRRALMGRLAMRLGLLKPWQVPAWSKLLYGSSDEEPSC